MTTSETGATERDERLGEVIFQCLQALEAGQGLDPQELLDRYPDFTAELVEFFSSRAEFEQLAAALRDVSPATPVAGQTAGPTPREAGAGRGFPDPTGRGNGGALGAGLLTPPNGGFFDGYDLLGEIAQGGMGVVYRARQHQPNRLVALKVIRADRLDAPAEVRRFRNEAETVAALDHPHIVPVYEVGGAGDQLYFSMKLVEGGSLADRLSDFPADPQRAARLLAVVARAVHHAHQRGVLHRDLKPSNILLDTEGQPHVTDFGLAKRVAVDSDLTQSGALVGTPSYMAPEQASASKAGVTTATDVYGLGAVLYALLTGRPPFRGETVLDTLVQVREREPESPGRVNSKVDLDLEAVCLKCLHKDPARRYGSAEALAEDLERWLKGEPTVARPAGSAERLWRWARKHRVAVAVGVCLLLTLTALAGSAGWVLGDRAARRTATEQEASAALDEAAQWQREGRVPEALAAARRAAWLVKNGVVGDVFRQRVQARKADLELVAELEEARLRRTAVREGHYNWELGDRLYAEAFRRADLDFGALSAEEAGERIRQSSVATELAAVLGDWALTRLKVSKRSGPSLKHLLRVARAADPDPWRDQVRSALERGDPRALAKLARSKEVSRQLPLTLVFVADALWSAGAVKAAKALLRQAQQKRPGDFWANQELALVLAESQAPRWDQAIGFFRVAIALRPQSPGAHLNLGWAFGKQGRLGRAIAAYRQAIRVKDNYPEAHNNLGAALNEKGRLAQAIAAYRQAIRLKRDYPEAHFGLGNSLYGKGRLSQAIAAYRQALRLKKNYPEAYCNLGNALSRKGQLDQAIAAYRQAILQREKFPEAHHNLGLILAKSGRLDQAIAAFRQAIRHKKDFPEAHYDLGIALAEKGRPGQAIAAFEQAIRLRKENPKAHFNLGIALNKKGRPDQAIAAFRQAIRFKKDYPEAHYYLGIALNGKGQLVQAIAAFKQAIFFKKDYPEALNGLGSALGRQGRGDQALAAFRHAIRLKKDYPDAHFNLGNALAAKGLLDQAIAAYRQAICLKEDFPEAHHYLGRALHEKGRLDPAIAAFKQAIRIKKDFAEAHYDLGIALKDQGKFSDALKACRRGHELGSKRPGWPYYASAKWVALIERLVALDRKLPPILGGKAVAANGEEALMLAWVCLRPSRRLFAAAARFYTEGFKARPGLAENLGSGIRYSAACAAALAGGGQGQDAKKLNATERSRLRRQALDWLRADLAAWRKQLEKQNAKVRPLALQTLTNWQRDNDLAHVRGKALAKLPSPERQPWRQLWADVEALRKSAARPPTR
jgi:serine/threonine-protein kinase